MSKELVIGSNRHETKVAILEEDQLVEVYFQRANEYSLAGSIHKGRVTRVLPGMQSAFVDLGLERDTFLYVSDFFEEHGDEFERVEERPVSKRESGGSRQDHGRAQSAQPSAPPAIQAQPVVPQLAGPEPDPEPTEAVEPELPPVPTEGRPEDQDGRDRRGRRSRRRRSRGRGFPDSKYASEVAREGSAEPDVVDDEAEPAEVLL